MVSSVSYESFVWLMRETRNDEAAKTRHTTGGGPATRVRDTDWDGEAAAGAPAEAGAQEEKGVELNAATGK